MPAEKKPEQARRTKALLIHLTQGEWDKVERAARLVGQPAEVWVRAAALVAAGTLSGGRPGRIEVKEQVVYRRLGCHGGVCLFDPPREPGDNRCGPVRPSIVAVGSGPFCVPIAIPAGCVDFDVSQGGPGWRFLGPLLIQRTNAQIAAAPTIDPGTATPPIESGRSNHRGNDATSRTIDSST